MLATKKCPKCKEYLLEFEQIHAMRCVFIEDGKEVYHVKCPKCGFYNLKTDNQQEGGK